jgi:DNA invertase Pin-like site-specific DNA recombinase
MEINEIRKRRSAGRPPKCVSADYIRQLHSQGLSFRQIARQTGFGYGTVRRAYYGAPAASHARWSGSPRLQTRDAAAFSTLSPAPVNHAIQ